MLGAGVRIADRGSWLCSVDLCLSSVVVCSVLTVGGPARDFPVGDKHHHVPQRIVSAVSDRVAAPPGDDGA